MSFKLVNYITDYWRTLQTNKTAILGSDSDQIWVGSPKIAN